MIHNDEMDRWLANDHKVAEMRRKLEDAQRRERWALDKADKAMCYALAQQEIHSRHDRICKSLALSRRLRGMERWWG